MGEARGTLGDHAVEEGGRSDERAGTDEERGRPGLAVLQDECHGQGGSADGGAKVRAVRRVSRCMLFSRR